MSVQDTLRQYRGLLERQAEARKALIDIEVEIQLFDKALELQATFAGTGMTIGQSAAQAFIEQHGDKLDADDIEFLQAEYRRIGEVHSHTQIPQTSLKRLVSRGKIAEGPRTESGYRRFATLSVMEYLLDAADES